MKMKMLVCIGVAALLAAVTPLNAQTVSTNASGGTTTVSNPITTQSFLNSAEIYFTSFNTNYNFTNITMEVSTGYKQVTGVNAASFLDAQYDLANGVNFGASFQFSGVGSAVNTFEAGIGYNIIRHYDTAVDVRLMGGYDTVVKAGVIEPGLTLKKKMTPNTFSEIGVSLPIYLNNSTFNNNPTFWVGAGFTF